VATHRVAQLWRSAEEADLPIGRLPVGSYFRVLDDGVDGRLPVSYLGNATVEATDGWVDASAVGPIPVPAADWTEPDWPPRRLVLGIRNEVVRGDSSVPLVALTFDAGAAAGSVQELLDVLSDRGVRSTFFVTGAFADRYPGVVERVIADGHELANHSYSHPDFRGLSDEGMRTELRRASASLHIAAGVAETPLWRPPFGGRDERVLRVVEQEGFRSIYWTFDSGDWIEGATTERVRSTVLGKAEAGAIVVHHVSPAATARAMPAVIDELRRRGLEPVTVSELLGER
jgi:peptidoglycan/xylan/chitin deacetylase (PgdA/CDA1 family)